MTEMKENGEIEASPNTHCYTAVINSCAYAENDAVEKREALQVAIETYKEHCASTTTQDRPNAITFFTMFTALRNLLPASPKRSAAITSIAQTCIEEGQMAEFVLRRLKASLSPTEFRDIVGSDGHDERIDMSKIPSSWTRNTKR